MSEHTHTEQSVCDRPPYGWTCSRPEGHKGPCAGRPDVGGLQPMPRRIGICPYHADEFYYPLADDEGLMCPQCSFEMVVYERKG